ncbi:hypothetical protein BDV18DRAFT_160523 [Aspergillus unguis]
MSKIIKNLRRRSSTHRPKPPAPRRLYVTSNTPTFDSACLRLFEAEGFSVEYLPFLSDTGDIGRDRRELETILHEREDDLEPGERYVVVSFYRPAYLLYLAHHQSTSTNPFPRLCALVAFYPDVPNDASYDSPAPHRLPPSTTAASTSASAASETAPILNIQIHLAGTQNESLPMWEDSSKRHRCHVLFYPESEPGFADSRASAAYDPISSRLAWSRALDCLKRGFGWPVGGGDWGAPDPELVCEGFWRNVWESATRKALTSRSPASVSGAPDMLSLMVGGGAGCPDFDERTSVNCLPSGAGGSSPPDISSFFSSQFIPSGPPSQHIRLLARTTGANRVIDELLLTFEHTEEIPWLLPGVPPTGRSVSIPIVLTVSFLAGKIARQNWYWDQASVLVQVGLLDPALIPQSFKATGANCKGKNTVEKIPVVGEEAAARAVS